MTSRSPKRTLQRNAGCEADQNIAEAAADSPLAIGTSASGEVHGIVRLDQDRIANATEFAGRSLVASAWC